MEEFGESTISKLTNHAEDNVIKEGVQCWQKSFSLLTLKKLMAKDDLLVMDEDLANNEFENMVISNNFPKNIMEDYLGGSFTYND